MAQSEKIPTYGICNLVGDNDSQQDIIVYDLASFVDSHKDLVFPHRHSFYQVLYISSGSGKHIIDFETFDVAKGMLYFMAPGQVHTWLFDENVQGYLINFNANLFSSFLLNSHYVADFRFFSGNCKYGVYQLETTLQSVIEPLFQDIQAEQIDGNQISLDIIRTSLLQIFLLVSKNFTAKNIPIVNRNNYHILRNFEKLIEQNFQKIRLPKEYADLLFITPNHLNAVCKESSGKSAGELIRDRILLEAKRCLINSHESIAEIAFKLNFEDNSYFTKFFKKYALLTPEEFRNHHRQKGQTK